MTRAKRIPRNRTHRSPPHNRCDPLLLRRRSGGFLPQETLRKLETYPSERLTFQPLSAALFGRRSQKPCELSARRNGSMWRRQKRNAARSDECEASSTRDHRRPRVPGACRRSSTSKRRGNDRRHDPSLRLQRREKAPAKPPGSAHCWRCRLARRTPRPPAGGNMPQLVRLSHFIGAFVYSLVLTV